MVKLNKFNLWYSLSLLFISFFLMLFLAFQYGYGVLSYKFINVYLGLGVAGVFGFALFIFYDYYKNVKKQNAIAATGFISEDAPGRRILNGLKIVLPIIFAVVIILFQVGLKSEIVPVPIPYDVAPGMSMQDALATHGAGTNIFWIGVYPGLYEEMAVFLIVTLLVGFLTLLWRLLGKRDAFRNPLVLLVNAPVACMIGAFIFAGAHKLSYGTNAQLYTSAWLFEFFAQLINQFTGMFTSFIPHIIHNSLIAGGLLVGLSIGSYVLASGLGFIPGQKIKKLIRGDKV